LPPTGGNVIGDAFRKLAAGEDECLARTLRFNGVDTTGMVGRMGQPLASLACSACHSALVTRVELLGGICQECLAAEARRHRDETGGWVAPNVRDLQERVLARVAGEAERP
jgi:hypothetical protein